MFTTIRKHVEAASVLLQVKKAYDIKGLIKLASETNCVSDSSQNVFYPVLC